MSVEDNMTEMRAQYEHLHKIMAEHPALLKAFQHDATVHSWLKMAEMGRCNVEDALIGIVVKLAEEKKGYFDEVVRLHTLLPLDNKLYSIVRRDGNVGIKHLVCGMVSYNKNDVENRYCGYCKAYVAIEL